MTLQFSLSDLLSFSLMCGVLCGMVRWLASGNLLAVDGATLAAVLLVSAAVGLVGAAVSQRG